MIDFTGILNIKPSFSYNEKAAEEQNKLKGWIFFPEIPLKEIIIEIIYDKKVIGEFRNNYLREDVKLKHNHPNGFCGFFIDLNDIKVPKKIKFQSIELKIKNTNFYIKKIEPKTIISFQNIYKKYENKNKDFCVLNNINFAINRHDCVGIVGKNGQGKSTLLSLIGGVEKPDKGKIIINGEASWPIGKAGGFQGSLTARENCTFVCKLYLGDKKNKAKQMVDKIEKFADIGDYFDLPIKTYSSGMKSRISFALSIFMEFDIYLVDEITAVGDQSFRKKCQSKFEEIKGRRTLIMATHNLDEIRKNCNKLIIVNKGQIKLYDNVKQGLYYYQDMFLFS